MKVDYLSDLHSDFWVNFNKGNSFLKMQSFVIETIPEVPGEVLVLAGDLSHYNEQTIQMLTIYKDYYNEVIIVTGNHDMYLVSKNQQDKYSWSAEKRLNELKVLVKEIGCHLLDGDVIEIDGIRFGGTSGWYDISDPIDYRLWLQASNDSHLISPKYHHKYRKQYKVPEETSKFWDSEMYYKEQQENLTRISKEGCDVLITHVVQLLTPSGYQLPQFRGDALNKFYYEDNFNLLKDSGCQFYIHGHVHNVHNYHLGGMNILCTPFGYPGETTTTKCSSFEINPKSK